MPGVNKTLTLPTMLTTEEKAFVEYWQANRLKRKSLQSYLSAGLPLGVLMVAATLINIYSDWFKGAARVFNTNSNYFLIVVIACILIIFFFVIFSARFKWEMNEQYYRELLSKKDLP
jgi:predicted neutral ceramidase superfamily lipid hydrolase